MRQDAFFALVERLAAGLGGDEVLLCNLDGEDSDFVRLNHNRVRQAGSVRSYGLDLHLVLGRRHLEGGCNLTGDRERDLAVARDLLGRLRERLTQVPDDPYLNYSTTPARGESSMGEGVPVPEDGLGELIGAADGLDLVGIWASGWLFRGFASSLGHRHWHQCASFNLDWSCYLEKDKAVKAGYSGFEWEPARLRGKLDAVRRGLEVMARPARTLEPGRYRAYLAPEAVLELMDMLAWGGFGLKSYRTVQTPLLRMLRGERRFDPRVSIHEDQARGLAPAFTPEGFGKPGRVSLISGGTFKDCLVDSRSGAEYGLPVNAGAEYPESLGMDAGDLPSAEVLDRLGTGLYIGNLWYLNYADRNDCRVTGMTRFGTFWVEDGELRAPVNVMRFDDSLYHLLGDRLEGLTREREMILSASTYGGRSTASYLLPGILVKGIELTL
ncbi:MAG: metallopeptidase TldD-related protein [Pseudomonadota bacterium]|nr:metallopeptidase TldD-related protein [Pseudomonadota bacterium]